MSSYIVPDSIPVWQIERLAGSGFEKYPLRLAQRLGPEVPSTHIDDDGSNDFDPDKPNIFDDGLLKRKRESIYEEGYEPERQTRPTRPRIITYQYGRNIGESLIVTLKFKLDAGRVWFALYNSLLIELHIAKIREASDHDSGFCSASPDTAESLSNRTLERGARKAVLANKKDNEDECNRSIRALLSITDLNVGHPEARGCKQCFELNQTCDLLQEGSSYPCYLCRKGKEDCELVIPPEKKAACERCKKKRISCSYRHEGSDHTKDCDACILTGYKCLAGPLSGRMRTGPSLDQHFAPLAAVPPVTTAPIIVATALTPQHGNNGQAGGYSSGQTSGSSDGQASHSSNGQSSSSSNGQSSPSSNGQSSSSSNGQASGSSTSQTSSSSTRGTNGSGDTPDDSDGQGSSGNAPTHPNVPDPTPATRKRKREPTLMDNYLLAGVAMSAHLIETEGIDWRLPKDLTWKHGRKQSKRPTTVADMKAKRSAADQRFIKALIKAFDVIFPPDDDEPEAPDLGSTSTPSTSQLPSPPPDVPKKTIITRLAHPIQLNYYACADDPIPPCHFHPVTAYLINGLAVVTPEVIDSPEGEGYTEVSGGHFNTGYPASRMCVSCVQERVRIINCPGHVFDRLPDSEVYHGPPEKCLDHLYEDGLQSDNDNTNTNDNENDNDNDDIEAGKKEKQEFKWCAVCPMPAKYKCVGRKWGCGLVLCESCRGWFTNEYEGKWEAFIEGMIQELGLAALRSDVEMLLKKGEVGRRLCCGKGKGRAL